MLEGRPGNHMADQLQLDLDPDTPAEAARAAAFADFIKIRTETRSAGPRPRPVPPRHPQDTATVWVCPACGAGEPHEFLRGTNQGIHREYLVHHDNGDPTHTDADGHLRDHQKTRIAGLRPEIRAPY
ncbi:hypothetical protein D2E76_16170 [Mycobacteroides abscessus]|uniref:HNH endonuclease n=2 Tax=Mycobacteroides abscessus TaxID=36809 RepID=A0ABD7HM65_9MYCO|nr:hypothetical protein D2E76_16170 [Mycobacteroides abscessus]